MRHLFLVHSHITHRVAECAVERRKLAESDVLLLAARRFTAEASHLRCLPIPYTPESFPSSLDWIAARRRLAELDARVADWTGGQPFHFYTPQTKERFIRLVLSHPLCRGFSLLEEGLNSYLTREEMETVTPTLHEGRWDRFCYRRRLGDAPFFEVGEAAAYGTTAAAFPGMKGRVVLDEALARRGSSPLPEVHNVLALDSMGVYHGVGGDGVAFALTRLLDRLRAEGEQSLHYKLHPAQLGTAEEERFPALLEAAAPPLRVERLGEDVSLEELAAADRSTRFFVNLSSVGFYAALGGCPAFSYARWVAQVEPAFAEAIDRVPAVFWREVVDLSQSDGLRRSESPACGSSG